MRAKAEIEKHAELPATDTASRSAPADSGKGQNDADSMSSDEENASANTVHSQATTAASTTSGATSPAATVTSPSPAPQQTTPTVQTAAQETGKENTQKNKANLVGKINNLVTTDLNNISNGRDFPMLCECFRGTSRYFII